MIGETKEIDSLLMEIDSQLTERTKVFLIGGGAMMYNALKAYTKDLDMVTTSLKEYETIRDALFRIGFESTKPTPEYCRFNLSNILQREDGNRIDLFYRTVCNKLKLSDEMVERATLRFEGKYLSLYSCSPSDIIVFKSITDRDGDIQDCISLIRSGDTEWKVVLEEILNQVNDGEGVWITWVEDKMRRIHEESQIRIPILKELTKLSDEFIAKWEQEMIDKLPEDER